MAALLPDIKSLFGSKASQPVAESPAVGSRAPLVDGVNYEQAGVTGTLVAFVRHCGCPFAEQEVRWLAKVQTSNRALQIVIVAHSDKEVVQDWFDRIGKPHFSDLSNVTVRADPEYKLYNAFGIGQLGWSQLFAVGTLSGVKQLASQGIKNTSTGHGSNRWLNSGGFAIDKSGFVRWAKVAEQAADMCDYDAAAKTLIERSKM